MYSTNTFFSLILLIGVLPKVRKKYFSKDKDKDKDNVNSKTTKKPKPLQFRRLSFQWMRLE